MNIEYIFSLIVSICTTLSHVITIVVHKKQLKTEKEYKMLTRKSILWDIIFSVIQVNMGYNYLIRPWRHQDVVWSMLYMTALIAYFISCGIFLYALWYYYKRVR